MLFRSVTCQSSHPLVTQIKRKRTMENAVEPTEVLT